jgi:hypothetical protein
MKTKFLILLTVIFIAQIYLASALTISSVSSNPNEVQPGEKFSLDLKIENNLEDDVENVIVSLILNDKINPVPFAPYQSSSEYVIDEINNGDDEKASFDLIAFADAISGTYTIPVQVSYKLNNGTQGPLESLGVVSIIINAKPKIDVSSGGNVLIRGINGKISIKVINLGLGDAKFLSISLKQISGMQITNSDKVYIGNIDSNDFDTADFNVFVNADAPSSVNLPVELTYIDSRNNEITENKIISIKTYTAKEATELGLISGNNTFLIIVSLVGFLVLFLIYRRIRKRNKSKRNGQ